MLDELVLEMPTAIVFWRFARRGGEPRLGLVNCWRSVAKPRLTQGLRSTRSASPSRAPAGNVFGEDIATSLSQPDEPCWILADPNQVHQIIINLAVNARDAMPKGGQLSIAVDAVEVSMKIQIIRLAAVKDTMCNLTVTTLGLASGRLTDTHLRAILYHQGGRQGKWAWLATVFGIVQQAVAI